MQRTKAVVFLMASLFIVAACPPQSPAPLDALFEQLRAPVTTDQAADQWSKLGKADPDARKYLATHLAALIEHVDVHYGSVSYKPWENAVRLAGELKLAEVSPSLAKWLEISTGRGTIIGINTSLRLEDNSPGKALSQIGDPAIPALEPVLSHGSRTERLRAIYVLRLMHSPKARKALQAHMSNEPDESLRGFIESILANWPAT